MKRYSSSEAAARGASASVPADETTRDDIGRGRLTIRQPRHGYRFNVDSIILAAFASPPCARVCDLGTGSGIVGLWLAGEADCSVTAVELQPALADLARINASENGLEERFEVVEDDLRLFRPPGGGPAFDQVVSNPPFSPLGRGRVDSNHQRAIARHEIEMTLDDLFAAAGRLLRPGGRFDLIHRADRELELLECAVGRGLWPTRLRRVLPRRGRRPTRVLLEAARVEGAGSGLPPGPAATRAEPVVEPPLVMHDELGRYAPEVATLLGD